MLEILVSGLVLKREPRAEFDERVTLFTREDGRLKAKTTSSRKILSKLSPHLEVGNFVKVRLVQKNDLQIVDALKEKTSSFSPQDLWFLDQLLLEENSDERLWQTLRQEPFSWSFLLKTMGWDQEEASCAQCGGAPDSFVVGSQEYFCLRCAAYQGQPSRVLLLSRASF